MEISLLCGQDLFLTLYDPEKKKLISYQSSNYFDLERVRKLNFAKHEKNSHEKYTNEDYDQVSKWVISTK